jgi:D-beta-D-heptose 7-phosphate kinase/D-beta-D-heptose 1-phosphate adenosyltransferase
MVELPVEAWRKAIMNGRLRQVLETLGRPRILVLGDMMIDRYVHGDAERISQEAPIQVLRVAFEDERLGGAGAVANNLAALGAAVDVVSIVGDDGDGVKVLEYLKKIGAGTAAVRRVKGRPTTVKTRFVGRAQQRIPQQVLRVDHEDTRAIDAATEAALAKGLEKALGRAAVLLISDYGKGVVTPRLCQRAIRAARRRKVPVLIDPIKSADYSRYRGATLLTPNRVETEVASGLKIAGEASLRRITERLIADLKLESLAITLDKEGAYVAARGARGRKIATRPRNVFDNAGAGDMFISVLALALASGAALEDAVGLANVAGGIEVEKFGVQTVSREELATDLVATSSKIRTLKQLEESVARDRANRARVVFTNGCFDLLHHGHVEYLEYARSQGDRLVVGLNSDASVRRLKGEPRPLVPEAQRARVLAGLVAVDYIVIFEEDTPEQVIRAVRPDVLVKGEDWRAKGVVGSKFVEGYGGKVVLAPLVGRASSTEIIEKARRAKSAGRRVTTKTGVKGRKKG